MRLNLCRLVVVSLALCLFAGDALAGPFARLRAKRQGGCAGGSCTPSYAPSPVHGAVSAPQGGCPGGRCPLPTK